ncbi:LacI family DNA-binding transcriptional regulator [Phytohabitans rumicis]|uniref:LacI family transcriptional regulator n=1 Tax=Phytohabitans rumicis TaxID=1076125 RepID=A0A6V8LM24_9ACTN|nr:LacI family DNA-binding transcriptional regulator [Phytohabitans rumicis]GFJ96590.1 LacI family transcriptional regulator [Phytohabitans rumicis]
MSSTKPPTQRDVARYAGVSTATVSYILSGRRDRANPVTEQTRERVLSAVRTLGYQRNHAARSLRRQRTEFVAVVYRPPSSPWGERLVDQLHEAARGQGYSVIVLPAGPDDRTGNVLRVLREQYVDGALMLPNHSVPDSELAALAQHGLALVVYDDETPPAGFDVVRQDQTAACHAAVSHLVDSGRRRIAYLGHGQPGEPPEDDLRFAAYRTVLADRGLERDDSLVRAAADSRSAAYQAATAMLSRPDRPDAIFSGSDRGALAAIWAAIRLGLRVPDDVAVVGVGNTDEGAVVSPALTSVGTPRFDFTAVVDRLFERIHQPGTGTVLHQPWELIVRQST